MHHEELNRLRGFAIALVLLGHSILVYPVDLSGIPWCHSLHNYIYSFHMPLFFLLSGLFYGFGSKKTTLNLLRNKFNRLMVPFLIWNALTIVAKLLFSGLVNRQMNMSAAGYLAFFTKGGSLWFLYVLFFIFLLNRLLERLESVLDQKFIFLLLWIPPLLSVSFAYFPIAAISFQLIFFYFGRMLAPHYSRLKEYGKNPYLLLYSATIFILVGSSETESAPRLVQILLPFSGILFAAALVFRVRQALIDRILSLAGSYSLQLYLLDGYLLAPTRYLLVRVLQITNPSILIFTIFLVKMALGLALVHWLLSRSFVTRWLIGLPAPAQSKPAAGAPEPARGE